MEERRRLSSANVCDGMALLKCMRSLQEDATIDDILRAPTELASLLANSDSNHPLVLFDPQTQLDDAAIETYFESTTLGVRRWNPDESVVGCWNNIYAMSSKEDAVIFFGTKQNKLCADNILDLVLPWRMPSTFLIARLVKEQCVVGGIELNDLDSAQLPGLIKGNLLPTQEAVKDQESGEVLAVADPFSLRRIVFEKPNGHGMQSEIQRVIADLYPGISHMYRDNGEALRAMTSFSDKFEWYRIVYGKALHLLESNSTMCEDSWTNQIPDALIEQTRMVGAFKVEMESETPSFKEDFSTFHAFRVDDRQFFLPRLLKRFTTGAKIMGLISTQVPAFILALTHCWGTTLNAFPSLLNLVLVVRADFCAPLFRVAN